MGPSKNTIYAAVPKRRIKAQARKERTLIALVLRYGF
jgi:hypothetical protein